MGVIGGWKEWEILRSLTWRATSARRSRSVNKSQHRRFDNSIEELRLRRVYDLLASSSSLTRSLSWSNKAIRRAMFWSDVAESSSESKSGSDSEEKVMGGGVVGSTASVEEGQLGAEEDMTRRERKGRERNVEGKGR